MRIVTTISFDEDFETFSEEGAVEIFQTVDGEDPLDEDATPSIGPLPWNGMGRRIPAPFHSGE